MLDSRDIWAKMYSHNSDPDDAGILCQFKCHSLSNRSLKVIYINGLGKQDLWVVKDVSPFASLIIRKTAKKEAIKPCTWSPI